MLYAHYFVTGCAIGDTVDPFCHINPIISLVIGEFFSHYFVCGDYIQATTLTESLIDELGMSEYDLEQYHDTLSGYYTFVNQDVFKIVNAEISRLRSNGFTVYVELRASIETLEVLLYG